MEQEILFPYVNYTVDNIIYSVNRCSLYFTRIEHTCTCKNHGISQEIFPKFTFCMTIETCLTVNISGPLGSSMSVIAIWMLF